MQGDAARSASTDLLPPSRVHQSSPVSRQERGGGRRIRLGVVVGVLAMSAAVAALSQSPALAAGPDVDSEDAGVHQDDVDYLRRFGVFDGTECSPDRICPGEPLKRWVMAVWMVRVLDGEDPQAATGSRFADVPRDAWWAPHVERLAQLSVTRGCRNGLEPRFCPDGTVTRAQMAAMINRAFNLKPAAAPAGFVDTAGSFAETDIDTLAAVGITFGCRTDPLQFCPDRDVTRAQMASFLTRAIIARLFVPE